MTTTHRYSLDELEELPTLCVGQADNLKIEKEDYRVWLCRCGIADGLPYDDMVTIEERIDDEWVVTAQYPAI